MPTGIEEALAAVAAEAAAALEAGAALSPFAGTPDPAGSAVDAGDAAAFGTREASPSADTLDGDPSAYGPASAGGDGGESSAPVTGDRPPGGNPPNVSYYNEDEPMIIIVGSPSGEPGPDPADQAPAPRPETPPPPPPAPEPGPSDPGRSPSAPPGQVIPQPPGFRDDSQAPPAGEREPEAPGSDRGPGIPEREPGPWAAGLADRWEAEVEWTPSALLFDESGEETNQRAKQAMEDWIAENLLDDDPEQGEGERVAKVIAATVLKSAGDVGLDMVVTPLLDPGTIPRGFMRTGTASAQGIEEIEQGKTLEGSMKIVGEVSGVVLMVLAPVRAGGVKRIGSKQKGSGRSGAGDPATARLAPEEPSITLSLEKRPIPKSKGDAAEVKTAHNVIEVQSPNAAPRRTHLVKDFPDPLSAENPVGKVVDYGHPVEVAKYDTFTRPMTPAEAQAAIRAMDNALQSNYAGMKGGVGPYSNFAEHCATHAAAVAQAGGVWTTGRLGSHVNFYLFKYMSPLGAQNAAALMAESATVNNSYPR